MIYWCGHGRSKSGNWVFKDGSISLGRVMEVYLNKRINGRKLLLISECCSSGGWCKEMEKTFNKESVREKLEGVEVWVQSSCLLGEDSLLNSKKSPSSLLLSKWSEEEENGIEKSLSPSPFTWNISCQPQSPQFYSNAISRDVQAESEEEEEICFEERFQVCEGIRFFSSKLPSTQKIVKRRSKRKKTKRKTLSK